MAERSGVLNLGVEGMMVMGAVVGFAAGYLTGTPLLGVLAAILAGMALAALFGFVTLVLAANQVASGLALTLLGLGLSGLIGDRLRRPAARARSPQPRHSRPDRHSVRRAGPVRPGPDLLCRRRAGRRRRGGSCFARAAG